LANSLSTGKPRSNAANRASFPAAWQVNLAEIIPY
jgi:hypothetical protein